MHKNRPVNLNLLTIRFPVMAIISILHRISGIILFLLLPLVLCGFEYSLSSQEAFTHLQAITSSFWVRFFIWVILSSLIYHVIAGIRHLFMDAGIGESKCAGRYTAYFVLVLSVIVILFLGIGLFK
ncbi:MAG: succinate dehydrogenase, cytochrome b556 subunit [Gammaproteobacteria bacterium]